jgi:Ca2+-dependent lipid-binding protein
LACYAIEDGSQACAKTNFPPIDAKCRVNIHEAKITGGCWDTGCGAPDPYVRVSIGQKVTYTSTEKNSFSPKWNEKTNEDVSYEELLKMEVALFDEDFTSPDLMVVWTAKGNRWEMSQPQSQSFTLTTTDQSINLSITINCSY